MSFAFGDGISLDDYNRDLTVMSVVIVVFALWLFLMMLSRAVRVHRAGGQDVAAMTYIFSTAAVFFVVAGRAIFVWPRETTLAIVFAKMVSVVAITLWARAAKSEVIGHGD